MNSRSFPHLAPLFIGRAIGARSYITLDNFLVQSENNLVFQ